MAIWKALNIQIIKAENGYAITVGESQRTGEGYSEVWVADDTLGLARAIITLLAKKQLVDDNTDLDAVLSQIEAGNL